MTQHETHRKRYHQAREAFDELKIEDRAIFLLEATVTTVARGVEEAGRALADELDRFFHGFRAERAEPSEPSRGAAKPGPAEPPTSAQTAPRTRKKRQDGDDAESPSA